MYSLKEIEELRNQTIDAIADAIVKETADGYKTARELADACKLCSSHHIANSIYNSTFMADSDYHSKLGIKTSWKTITKTRHFIEVDENGNPIGTMDIVNKYDLRTYKATCDKRV